MNLVIRYGQDESWFVIDEFNMIWVWCMCGMIHGLKMMSLVWFLYGIWMKVGYKGWHEICMHDQYILDGETWFVFG